ncbi:MAG: fatty acid desaturase [Acidobacteriota bacterium]
MTRTPGVARRRAPARWNEILGPYKRADPGKAIFQLVTSALAFAVLWSAMLLSLEWSYGWTLLLAIPTAGVMVRFFIIQHDCGHGSFFRRRAADNSLGFILGILTLTPYHYWRRKHAIHHATSGNLDRRGSGDVTTLTVREYRALSAGKCLAYRLYRSSLSLLLVGPVYLFILKHRFPFDAPRAWRKEWAGVLITNLALGALFVLMGTLFGFPRFLMVQLPITLLAATAGVWLFYVQHQFEETYWERKADWHFHMACVEGSSFYDLPRILHWFTGNIGFHHLHHLSSLIPNYRLQRCMRDNPELQDVGRLSFWQSIRCARVKLWDEDQGKLIGFREMKPPGEGRKLSRRSD